MRGQAARYCTSYRGTSTATPGLPLDSVMPWSIDDCRIDSFVGVFLRTATSGDVIKFTRAELFRVTTYWSEGTTYHQASLVMVTNPQLFITRIRQFKCSWRSAKQSFYRSLNAVFVKLNRIALEIVLERVMKKCILLPIHGLEFSMSAQMKSFNCVMFSCLNIDDTLFIRKRKFLHKYCSLDNIVCLCVDIRLTSSSHH